MQSSLQPRMRGAILAMTLLALLVGTSARACDTPVYRYAMYNWVPADFEVYYLHGGQEHPDDATVNRLLDGFRGAAPDQVNVVLIGVNTTREDQLASMPEEVRSAWESHSSQELPLHVVLNPRGTVLFTGRLDESQAKAMIDSPARRKMAQLLHDGHSGVLLLLTTDDQAANAAATEALDEVVRMAAAGEIDADSIPGVEVEEHGEGAEGQSVGVLQVSREDEAESWFVRMLLSVEDDLSNYEDPMVFGIYGRGRSLEPYIGAGIVASNLAECVSFIKGACSCLVKEQNPGMDLLSRWDWDATAIAIAEQVGEEEGNEMLLEADSIFPQIVMTLEEPAAGDDSSQRSDEKDVTPDQPIDSGDLEVAVLNLAPETGGTGSELADSQTPATSATGTNATAASAAPPSAFAGRMSRILVIGAVVAFFALAAISFLLLRLRAGA